MPGAASLRDRRRNFAHSLCWPALKDPLLEARPRISDKRQHRGSFECAPACSLAHRSDKRGQRAQLCIAVATGAFIRRPGPCPPASAAGAGQAAAQRKHAASCRRRQPSAQLAAAAPHAPRAAAVQGAQACARACRRSADPHRLPAFPHYTRRQQHCSATLDQVAKLGSATVRRCACC